MGAHASQPAQARQTAEHSEKRLISKTVSAESLSVYMNVDAECDRAHILNEQLLSDTELIQKLERIPARSLIISNFSANKLRNCELEQRDAALRTAGAAPRHVTRIEKVWFVGAGRPQGRGCRSDCRCFACGPGLLPLRCIAAR